MRIGVVIMPRAEAGPAPLQRYAEIARQVESLGFHGLWSTDSMARGRATLDPLMLLTAAAAVTSRIELGTCVLQVPIRNPVELAHRAQTLNVLSAGRLRLGVGAGSTKNDFEALGCDYEARFKTLPASIATMQQVWRGEAVGGGRKFTQWPGTEGGPPVLLGAWRSTRWIDLAAGTLQGWVASGIHTTWEDLAIGLKMYRERGGKRAVVANIFTDLRPEPGPNPTQFELKIHLRCNPAQAKETLKRLAATGVDDALLVCPFDDPGQLEQIRELSK